MIKNASELIVLAQLLVSISYSFRLLVEVGGGKYQQYKWLTWHISVVSSKASNRNSPIVLAVTCCLYVHSAILHIKYLLNTRLKSTRKVIDSKALYSTWLYVIAASKLIIY